MVFRVLVFLWPFLKEMILGGKSLHSAIKTNKTRVLLIGVIFLSIILNFFTIPRLVKISSDYVVLKKKYDALPIAPTKPPVVQPPVVKKVEAPVEPVAEPPAPIRQGKQSARREETSAERYQKLKSAFDRIKAHEERERISSQRSN